MQNKGGFMKRTLILPVFAAVLCSTCVIADDDIEPPGFFLGAAGGPSANFYTQDGIREDSTGWKVFFGVRPLRYFGAEIQYVDFGSVRVPLSNRSGQTGRELVRAEGGFAVAYLPIAASPVELFAKAGSEHVTTSGAVTPFCELGEVIIPVRFAYGAGVQLRLPKLALRAEYERTLADCGNPRLLSFGLAYRF
jgi:hypothetical protein